MTGKIQDGISEIIHNSLALRIVFGFVVYLFNGFIVPNKRLLFFMLLFYVIDMITGTISSIIVKNFEFKKFFRGIFRFTVYGILILIAFGLDAISGNTNIVTSFMIAFIVVNDIKSIIQNLDEMGYKVPIFVERIISTYGEKMLKSRLSALNVEDSSGLSEEITDIISVYVPKISDDKMRNAQKIRLEVWKNSIERFGMMKVDEKDIVKSRFILLVAETVNDIEQRMKAANISDEIIQLVSDRNNDKIKSIINGLFPEDEIEDVDKFKSAIVRKIIVVLYSTITEILSK